MRCHGLNRDDGINATLHCERKANGIMAFPMLLLTFLPFSLSLYLGGIMKCDVIAAGVVNAAKQVSKARVSLSAAPP